MQRVQTLFFFIITSLMNLLYNRKNSLRQKPHILTIEQSFKLGQITGTKHTRHQELVSIYVHIYM